MDVGDVNESAVIWTEAYLASHVHAVAPMVLEASLENSMPLFYEAPSSCCKLKEVACLER